MTEATPVPFELGQVVIVGTGDGDRERWSQTAVRRVDPQIVWVDGAPDGQPALHVTPGDEVTCHTWRWMDAAYQARARVAFVRLDPEPLVGLTIVESKRIQQREYVRVPLTTEARGLHVRGTSVDPVEAVHDPTTQQFRLAVHDLSAGGLRGACSLPLSPGDELLIDLPLPAAESAADPPKSAGTSLHVRGRVVALPDIPRPLELRAKVVRTVDAPLSADLACEIGVVFMDVPREARERIIRFALGVQRDRRRRGML